MARLMVMVLSLKLGLRTTEPIQLSCISSKLGRSQSLPISIILSIILSFNRSISSFKVATSVQFD